ncbi:hypothetical protein NA23_09595 [Fervidobacterium islandicum]|uniref:Uncharacterized protein n=1 Tax=Fervidobacterium islandicum TaxID=2423 RepID=A0AAI8CNH6_FERIS|nr:hypothetical protein [Fervidobacterium islandicum]AMW33459.1 hypothetical protein NA23_09595 [Fervidobacterium islandicum]
MKKLGILIAVVLFGIFAFAQQVDMDALLNRIELLEEYTNMIYDTVGTKVSVDDFETALAEIDERLSELETKVLNIQSTIDTGLPALRDMLYELSANLAALDERLTSFVEVSLDAAKEEVKTAIMDELQPQLDDLKVTLDIHDSDILKIYDTLGMLSEQIAQIQEAFAAQEEASSIVESLALRLDMHDQDIVNIYDNLSMKADREQVDALEATIVDLQEQIAGLNEIITGLAGQIGDTDYLLRKQIDDTAKDLQAKIDTKASTEELNAAVKDLQAKIDKNNEAIEILTNRLELLEEYANMIYDMVGTKVSIDDFEIALADVTEKIDTKASKEELNAAVKDLQAKIDTKADAKAVEEKVNNVNMIAWLGVVLGAVAIVLPFVMPK